jgi:hypothetical protein
LITSNRLSQDTVTFGNNIQDIRPRTYLDEEEDGNNNPTNSTAEDEARLLATIAETMAATANVPIPLPSAATDVTPIFLESTANVPTIDMERAGDAIQPFAVVFETSAAPSAKKNHTEVYLPNRFVTSVTELNTLVYRTLQVGANANKNNLTKNATGSRESIVEWGKKDGLDTNQQIAFEILAATYVLTFHEDATGADTLQEREALKCLARHRPNKNEKLRMFITGPAGAGKCKSCWL